MIISGQAKIIMGAVLDKTNGWAEADSATGLSLTLTFKLKKKLLTDGNNCEHWLYQGKLCIETVFRWHISERSLSFCTPADLEVSVLSVIGSRLSLTFISPPENRSAGHATEDVDCVLSRWRFRR